MSGWERQLAAGLGTLGVEADATAIERLTGYIGLLRKWNRAYNLTSIRAPEQMVTHHLLDSAAVLPFVRGSTVLDVGTGAGLPGLVLAVLDDGRFYTLLDATGKKTLFCEHAIDTLGIGNASVVNARVEDYRPERPFDTVVARAFSSLAEFALLAGPACAPGGRLLAMKGADPAPETARLLPGWRVDGTHTLTVPGLDARRHVVVLERTGTD